MEALPPAASPARGPAPKTDALSIAEASEQYGISQSTIRRRLSAEAIPGAFQVSGPKGDEWRLPPGGLEAAGFQRVIEPELEQEQASELDSERRQLMTSLEALTSQLSRSQLQLEQAASERVELSVELARQEERLSAAKREIEQLQERLDEASRPWWKRRRNRASLPPPESS
jgi:DNA repair exonuclease SbcCD ATPase subunit